MGEISERYVRRRLYAPLHSAIVAAPPGFLGEVMAETSTLLAARRTPSRSTPSVSTVGGHIILRHIDYRLLLELTVRTTCAADVELIVGEGHVENQGQLEAVLRTVDWPLFAANGVGAPIRIKAVSSSSRLYHTGLLTEAARAAAALAGCVLGTSGEERESERTLRLRLDHNRLHVSVSLAGAPLWQRGYRAELSATAPLREDLAQCALRQAIAHARHHVPVSESRGDDSGDENLDYDVLFVPFSGSGTLAMEGAVALREIPPFLFRDVADGRYAFEHIPFGVPPSVAWLRTRLRDSLAHRNDRSLRVLLVDSNPDALSISRRNWERFSRALPASGSPWLTADFRGENALARPWRETLPPQTRSVFIPLNPPFGRRIKASAGTAMYRRIGERLEELAAREKRPAGGDGFDGIGVHGFVLCPDEDSWRAFLGAARSFRTSTSHFMQGGRDIRLCAFASQ